MTVVGIHRDRPHQSGDVTRIQCEISTANRTQAPLAAPLPARRPGCPSRGRGPSPRASPIRSPHRHRTAIARGSVLPSGLLEHCCIRLGSLAGVQRSASGLEPFCPFTSSPSCEAADSEAPTRPAVVADRIVTPERPVFALPARGARSSGLASKIQAPLSPTLSVSRTRAGRTSAFASSR